MARKKAALPPALDVTAPGVSLELDGASYRLCFTFAALSAAKAELLRIGNPTRLLQALMFPSSIDVDTIPALFYASLITHQPEITPAEVAQLFTTDNFGDITLAVLAAYEASRSKPEDGDKRGNVEAAG